MRIRIESAPGELEAKAPDVVRVIERLTGTILSKSEDTAPDPKPPEYPVLRESMRRSRREVDRIAEIARKKFEAVLAE